jgi:hypothetical protein
MGSPAVDVDDVDGEARAVTTKRFRKARAYRSQYDSGWERSRRYALGDQWANKIRPAWKSKPSPNYCFSTIETIIPIMTENRPTINVIAEQPEWVDLADNVQSVVRRVFFINRMERKYPVILRNSHWYGDGYAKIWYNAKKDDIEITSIDSRNLFPAPGTIELQEASYILIVANRWLDAIYRDYPELVGKITPGSWDESLTHKPVQTQSQQDADMGFENTTSGPIVSDPYGKQPGGNDEIATQIEMWERHPKTGKLLVSVVVNGVPAIKNGRKLWRVPSPFKHNLYPIAKCPCYPIDSQFHSVSEMSQLENPQDGINRMEAMIADVIRLCASPQMLVPRGSRVSMKDITNRIGGFIVHEDGKPPQWMMPSIFPQQVFEAQSNSIGHMDRISGVFEAARGQRPVGTTSGVAIQTLQQATAGRVGLKTKMFECFLQDIAVQVIPLVQQFYQNRTVRVGRNKYVDINKFIPGTKDIDKRTDISVADFAVEIGVGSTLPIDKGVRFDQSLELFQQKAIDKKTLLEDSGRSEEQVDLILARLDKELLHDAKNEAKIQSVIQPPAPPGGAAPAGEGGGQMDAKAVQAAEGELAPMSGAGLPSEADLAAIEAAMNQQI